MSLIIINSLRFIQQLKPTSMEYVESDRLDGKVARVFHKNIALEKYMSAAAPSSAVAAASASDAATLLPPLPPAGSAAPDAQRCSIECSTYSRWDRYINCYELRLGR